MTITITDEGLISPFGLNFLRDSRLELIAPTRDMTEENETGNGEIDFGTELKAGRMVLHGAITALTAQEKYAFKTQLAGQLLDCLTPQKFMVGDSADKFVYVVLEDKPDVVEHAGYIEVSIPLKTEPYWQDESESNQIGSGTISISGTMDTPIIIDILGPATNPAISVGSSVLSYAGSLSVVDQLVIDTDKKTVAFNGVNALKYFTGEFPVLPPGDTVVSAASGGTTTFKWRNRYL